MVLAGFLVAVVQGLTVSVVWGFGFKSTQRLLTMILFKDPVTALVPKYKTGWVVLWGLAGPHHALRLQLVVVVFLEFFLLTVWPLEQDVGPPSPGSAVYVTAAATIAPSLFGAMASGALRVAHAEAGPTRFAGVLLITAGVAALVLAVRAVNAETELSEFEWAVLTAGWAAALLSFVPATLFPTASLRPRGIGFPRTYKGRRPPSSVDVRRTSEFDPDMGTTV